MPPFFAKKKKKESILKKVIMKIVFQLFLASLLLGQSDFT
ncbi:uncharacterized protein METZ01_LOCUS332784, partial [marine metagenome]